ncbi:MAG TPA: hypothetical protein VHG35_08645 [Gemmatimonadales bacterium]|nr:hypothetical protein [Gemmatimonadales bacterium]
MKAESDTTHFKELTMRSKTLYLAAALVLSPAALYAQDANARVEAALEGAVEAGIPVSLLEQKIAEGKAKGVPMERIAVAVETRLEALTQARDAMTKAGIEGATAGELSVAADAVQGGVSQTALATVSQRSSGDNRAVAIAVLTDLVAMGHASEQALVRVERALARGPEALANLRAESAGQAAAQGGIGAAAGAGAAGGGVQVGAGASGRVELGTPRGK